MTILLSADEIEGMRDTLLRTFPESVVIYKQIRTDDDSGGFSVEWDDQAPTIGRIASVSGGVGAAMAETLVAGRIGTAEAWILSLPAETDVDNPDRVIINGDRGFEVVAVLAPRTFELNRRVVLVELG